MAVKMSCNSPFCFNLIRKTFPIYYPSSIFVTPFFLSHSQFLPCNASPPLSRFPLFGVSPEFPQNTSIPPPSFPLEVPQFSPLPEFDPGNPSELPPIGPGPNPGPEFPELPSPSPPGIEVPVPPHKPPDIEPPWPGSPVPGPDILPPPPPEEVPPRPSGPEIVTTPSPPGFVPPMSI